MSLIGGLYYEECMDPWTYWTFLHLQLQPVKRKMFIAIKRLGLGFCRAWTWPTLPDLSSPQQAFSPQTMPIFHITQPVREMDRRWIILDLSRGDHH